MKKEVTRILCPEDESRSDTLALVVRVDRMYPEIVGAVKNAYREMRVSIQPQKTRASEEKVRKELSGLTGRSLGRINKFLAHGEYVTNDCLERLCELGVDEDFFDAVQKVKQGLVKSMKSKGQSLEEIEREVSGVLPEIFLEYERKGRIDRKRWLKMCDEEPVKCNTWSEGEGTFGKPQILKYRTPNADCKALRPIEEREVLRRLQHIAREIEKVAERSSDRRCDLVQEIGRLLIKMADLHHSVLDRGISIEEETRYGTIH
jgi:hypothetical protein